MKGYKTQQEQTAGQRCSPDPAVTEALGRMPGIHGSVRNARRERDGHGAGREEMLFSPTGNPFYSSLSLTWSSWTAFPWQQPQDTCLAGMLVALRSYGIPWVCFRTG